MARFGEGEGHELANFRQKKRIFAFICAQRVRALWGVAVKADGWNAHTPYIYYNIIPNITVRPSKIKK